jgi:anaerobic selenocysteine-containing dehydrogenase
MAMRLTAALARRALPAATQFEKSSLHFMVDKYEPNKRIEWKPEVVAPAGDARPEWHVMKDICRAADVPFLNDPALHAVVVEHRARGVFYPERSMYEAVLPTGCDPRRGHQRSRRDRVRANRTRRGSSPNTSRPPTTNSASIPTTSRPGFATSSPPAVQPTSIFRTG